MLRLFGILLSKIFRPFATRVLEGKVTVDAYLVTFVPCDAKKIGEPLVEKKQPDKGSKMFIKEAKLKYHENGFMLYGVPWQVEEKNFSGKLVDVLSQADHLRKVSKPWYMKEDLVSKLTDPDEAGYDWSYDKAISYLVLKVSGFQMQMIKQFDGLRLRVACLDKPDDPSIAVIVGERLVTGRPDGKGATATLHMAGEKTNSVCTVTTDKWYFTEHLQGHGVIKNMYAPILAGLVQKGKVISKQQQPLILGKIWQEAITLSINPK